MYKAIVRRNVRTRFRALSAGDYEQVLSRFHPRLRRSCPIRRRTQRKRRRESVVSASLLLFSRNPVYHPSGDRPGGPWNTLVATRLSIAAPHADGSIYRNEAMQLLRLRWGKVVEDRLHEDIYKLVNELQERLIQVEKV